MPPQNSTDSDSKTHFPESGKPLIISSAIIKNNDSSELTQKPHETAEFSVVPSNKNKKSPEKELEATCAAAAEDWESGRERLKRHRVDVAGRVWIPDMWGQEGLMKDWIDCAAFDASLVNSSIMSARDSLVEEGRRANSTRLRVQNGC
ncbi:hypothetical protein PHJA_002924600 [Phtheirospermum japonicum]|uniref:Uncharacterized protein n=1 Tax=Phtheirospermum japonicum TaxID=374723 RepID=A0A830DM36_9LAMI|nr:hypothetical protein PHJA_002924600 [Phtheirospermum japonicum]